MVNAGWFGSMRSGIFLQMKFIIFQGCSTKQAAFLPGQPAQFNQFLIQPLLLVHFSQNAVFIGCIIFFSNFSHLPELIFTP